MSQSLDDDSKLQALRQVLGLGGLFLSGRRAFSERRKPLNPPPLPNPRLSMGGPDSPPRNLGGRIPSFDNPLKPPGPGWYICVRDGNRPDYMYVLDHDQKEVTRVLWIVARHLKIHDSRWFLPDPEDRDFALTIARAVMEIAYPQKP